MISDGVCYVCGVLASDCLGHLDTTMAVLVQPTIAPVVPEDEPLDLPRMRRQLGGLMGVLLITDRRHAVLVQAREIITDMLLEEGAWMITGRDDK